MSFIEIYTIAAIHVAAVPAVLYPLVYRNMPWRKGPTGRALMNMARSLAFLFVVSLIGFWRPFPGYDYAYAAGVTYLAGALGYQLRVVYRLKRHAQHRARVLASYTLYHERHDDDEATQAVRFDNARWEASGLADQGCAPEG